MTERNYLLISAMIFGLVGTLHLIRLVTQSSVQVGTVLFPVWGSWLGLVLAFGLCLWAIRLMSHWRGHLQ
ncbi:MAG: hypothetical protein Fur0046_09080 [Cyanobacteria bacterium J069]|nr:MAG: hypothetical protein D6742_12695 [Cyanobacteria bacterium J069]